MKEALKITNLPSIEESTHEILTAIGENPKREGLQKTPKRVAKMYEELTSGYHADLEELVNGAIFTGDYEEQVLVQNIEFFSLCEHHMLPFFGEVSVAYIPNGKIIGLSKIPRLVDAFSKRLQVQERLTQEIAKALEKILDAKGVAVFAQAQHMCSAMRGVKKPGTQMSSQCFKGVYRDNPELQRQFFQILKQKAL